MALQRTLMSLIGVGLATLVVCSIVLGYAASYFDSQLQPLNVIGLTASGVLMSFWSFVFGLPVVALYGVPVYSVLAKRGRATWLNILGAAALPCLAMAVFAWQAGALLAGFALPIATVMRAFHGAGPNNSFKPNPHRGGA
jgi:hypothetical protein